MHRPATVLIIELSDALAELECLVLTEAGYQAISSLCGLSSMQAVEANNPDVIVLDLGPHDKSCGWQLLGDLRSNVNSQGIPLVAVSDTEQLLEDAKCSFNVSQELIKPYDIGNLVSAVHAALEGIPLLPHPAPQPTTGKLSVDAAQAISRKGGEIMAEWLKRANQENFFGAASGRVPLRLLMDNISVWLVGLVSVLRYGEGFLGTSEIHRKLTGHIREMQQEGINLTTLIRQFEVLRDLVWQTLEESSLANLSTHDVFELGKTVNAGLDEVLAEAAQQYAGRRTLSRNQPR